MFEGRVQKISVNAGFTCPNRDGTRGRGGCTYCNNKTFQPTYCGLDNLLKIQLDEGIAFFSRKYKTMRYLAYFQSYTNTYAPVKVLRELYEEAINYPGVIGLVIATRPDCLSSEVLDLLEELSSKCYVMVELGIESVNNQTLEIINRGHTSEESIVAINELARRSIHNCAVGYDDAKEAILVRNSWGESWGMKGYFWLPYGYVEQDGLSADYWTIRLVE